MKLIYCRACHAAFSLQKERWLVCLCRKSGGQYNEDCVTVTIGGEALLFGIGNPFFHEEKNFKYLPPEMKQRRRTRWGYGDQHNDCWWGEFPGDTQVFRIESPTGPRLETKVELDEDTGLQKVTVIDSRDYIVKGVGRKLESVVVPRNK